MATDLPVHLTRFIGREGELASVADLLGRERLVTLTGPGGTGKTRLAGEVTARVHPAFGSIRWVDLAPISDGKLLARQVCVSLELAERSGVPFMRLAIEAIGEGRMLLVLDNCEHVVDAAASYVEALLRACPGLTILATSREALGIASEAAWLVPPLATPEAEQLFIERARAVSPGFEVSGRGADAVAEICRRLDGIPLAIELAAARARVLSPEQITARLDDAFRLLSSGSRTAVPRHRTLRATMEWSLALLGPSERTLLRRLAVFAGGFDLEAAEAVCSGGPIDAEDVLDGIATLVDKSWVVMEPDEGTARYMLLETVRQYARELLVEAGEAEALERAHGMHFLEFLERVEPQFVGGAMDQALVARVRRARADIRAAAAWMLHETSEPALALRLLGALFWPWYAFGSFRDLRIFAERALPRAADAPAQVRGRALLSAGLTGLAQGEYDRAVSQLAEAAALLKASGDTPSLQVATAKLGAAHLLKGDLTTAAATLDEAMQLTRDVADHDVRAVFAHFWRAWASYLQGDFVTARDLMVRNLDVGVRHGLSATEGHSRAVLARIHVALGDVERACAEAAQGLEVERTIRDGWGIALAMDAIALIAARRGRLADAVRLMAGTEALRERFAMAIPGVAPEEREVLLAELRTSLGGAFDDVWAEGRALGTDQLVAQGFAETSRDTTEHRVVTVAPAQVPAVAGLRVLALGPLQIFSEGELLDSRRWGSVRPRELLVHLLLHPEGRTKEQVGLAFWPDASPAQLRNSFHVTLHRLRRALGDLRAVVVEGERYRVDPAVVAEFDVPSFEKDLRAALTALRRQAEGAVCDLELVMERYRGDFLDGEPVGDWHLEVRDRLQRAFVDGMLALGDALARDGRHAKAAEAYRRVLARDELHEEALRALMRAQAELGERAQALRAFQRFNDRIRTELGSAPSAETERLAAAFRSG